MLLLLIIAERSLYLEPGLDCVLWSVYLLPVFYCIGLHYMPIVMLLILTSFLNMSFFHATSRWL